MSEENNPKIYENYETSNCGTSGGLVSASDNDQTNSNAESESVSVSDSAPVSAQNLVDDSLDESSSESDTDSSSIGSGADTDSDTVSETDTESESETESDRSRYLCPCCPETWPNFSPPSKDRNEYVFRSIVFQNGELAHLSHMANYESQNVRTARIVTVVCNHNRETGETRFGASIYRFARYSSNSFSKKAHVQTAKIRYDLNPVKIQINRHGLESQLQKNALNLGDIKRYIMGYIWANGWIVEHEDAYIERFWVHPLEYNPHDPMDSPNLITNRLFKTWNNWTTTPLGLVLVSPVSLGRQIRRCWNTSTRARVVSVFFTGYVLGYATMAFLG
jgi:hypothetical protein